MDFLKKHADTAAILGAVCISLLWMNSKMNGIELRLAKIETILILKGLVTPDLFANETENK